MTKTRSMRRSSFSPKDYQSSLKGCERVLRALPCRCGRLAQVVQRNQQICQGNQGARYFLEQIGELYRLEKQYKSERLTAAEIKERRNNAETNTIVSNLVCRLHDMLNIYDDLSSQMQKAVNYLKNFWKQLAAYRNDGNYSIDNNLAERSIRPMTVLRKNIMMYGSSKGAEISAIYHTIIDLQVVRHLTETLYGAVHQCRQKRKERLRKFTPEYNRKMRIELKIINFLSNFYDGRHQEVAKKGLR